MNRPATRGSAPALSVSEQKFAAEQRHNRVLLHALQTGHPVLRDGRTAFLKGLYFQENGGAIVVRVYLTGEPEPYAPEEITLAPNYFSIDLDPKEVAHAEPEPVPA